MPLYPILTSKNCTCMAVKSQPSLLKPDSSLYASVAKRQHPYSNKGTAISPTYRAQWGWKLGGANREPWISPPFYTRIWPNLLCFKLTFITKPIFWRTSLSSWCNCFSWFVIISQVLASKSMTLHRSFLSCSDFLGQLCLWNWCGEIWAITGKGRHGEQNWLTLITPFLEEWANLSAWSLQWFQICLRRKSISFISFRNNHP